MPQTPLPSFSFLSNALNSFSHALIITTTHEGIINFKSNNCRKNYHLPSIGENICNSHPILDTQTISNILNQVQKETSLTVHYTPKKKDSLYLEVSYAPILTSEQLMEGLVIIVHDITEKYESLQKIAHLDEEYQSLFENTAFGALIIDQERMELLKCNKVASNMLGIESNHPQLWNVNLLHHDLSKEELQKHRENVHNDHDHTYNASVVDKYGKRRELMVSCRNVTFHGRSCHLSILVDITEKKKYELELENNNAILKQSRAKLLEAQKIAHIGNWEFNVISRTTIWSDEFYKIFDLKPDEIEPTAEIFFNYVHPEDRESIRRLYQESIEKKLPYSPSYRIITKQGRVKYIRDRAQHFFDNNNNYIRSQGTIQEITEQKLVEIELRKSQKSYQSILDNMRDTYYRTNLKGELIYLSKGVEELAGYTIEELLGKNLADYYVDPNMRNIFLKNIAANHGLLSYQAQLRHKNKESVWMHSNSRYWHDDEGNIGGVEGFARNITKEKLAQDELAKSEERWLLALEGAKHGVWDWNIKTNIVYYSKQWLAMVGYKEGEIKNSFDGWIDLIHPQDIEPIQNALKIYFEGATQIYQIIFRMLNKKGKYVWIRSQGTIWERDLEGNPLRMVGTHSDITELKESQAKEKKLLDLIEASSNEIYVFNKENLRFTYLNQSAINNLQYSSTELYTQHAYDIKPEFTEEDFRDYIRPLIDGSLKEQRFESTHQRKDGSTYPTQVHLQLINTKSSEEFLAVVVDVSEQQQMNKKFKEQEEIMIVQSRHAAMGEMISMIAHQWRQPISVVGLLTNTLRQSLKVNKINLKEMSSDLKTIHDQIEYMSKTINDFRNFFQKSNTLEEVNLYYLLIEAKSILSAVLERQNIKLTIECPISITLLTYSRELVQVIINILSNAKDALMKVNEERNIIIHVEEKRHHISISIFNNGEPIDESIKDKIFEPYFTTKGNLGGTGLGLYMVKSILDKHMYGKVVVQNRDNGVAFNLTLPKTLELP